MKTPSCPTVVVPLLKQKASSCAPAGMAIPTSFHPLESAAGWVQMVDQVDPSYVCTKAWSEALVLAQYWKDRLTLPVSVGSATYREASMFWS